MLILSFIIHTNVWESMNGEALQLHTVHKKPYFLLVEKTSSVLLLVPCICNNTDGNKLVIFSGIALYYVITEFYKAFPHVDSASNKFWPPC